MSKCATAKLDPRAFHGASPDDEERSARLYGTKTFASSIAHVRGDDRRDMSNRIIGEAAISIRRDRDAVPNEFIELRVPAFLA